MLLRLIRNKPRGNAITGRLVIDGRWFCNTLERVGYEILALCCHVAVTQSPKFKRPLPIVQNVPRTGDKAKGDKAMRQGIRFHRGTKPEHSTGCILVLADNINDNTDNLRGNQLPAALNENTPCRSRDVLISPKGSNDRSAYDSGETLSKLSSNKTSPFVVGGRSSAEVETQLTQLLLQAQQAHEEIILEVIDYRAGTEYGYDHPCPPELQMP